MCPHIDLFLCADSLCILLYFLRFSHCYGYGNVYHVIQCLSLLPSFTVYHYTYNPFLFAILQYGGLGFCRSAMLNNHVSLSSSQIEAWLSWMSIYSWCVSASPVPRTTSFYDEMCVGWTRHAGVITFDLLSELVFPSRPAIHAVLNSICCKCVFYFF